MGDTLEGKYINQINKLLPIKATGQQVSMKKVFKKMFQMPSVLNRTLSYMGSLFVDSVNISNVIQGSLYKTISLQYSGKFLIPFGVYFDEWEANNAIGPHARVHKMGSVYISLLSIPPEFRSRLENIVLALLFLSTDLEE